MEGTQENTHTVADTEQQQGAPASASPETTPAMEDYSTADEATKLKVYNSMFGTNHTSLDEVIRKPKPTKAEIEAEEERERTEAMGWALSKGVIKREQIERAVAAKEKSDEQIAYELFEREIKDEDPKASPETIRALFDNHYHAEEEETSPVRKAALRQMQKVANAYRNEATAPYDGLLDAYRNDTASQKRYSGYTDTVKSTSAAIEPTFTYEYEVETPDGKTKVPYQFEIPADVREAVEAEFASDKVYQFIGADKTDVDPSMLKKEMNEAMLGRLLPNILQSFLKKNTEEVTKALTAHFKKIPSTGQPAIPGSAQPQTKKEPIRHGTAVSASRSGRAIVG